MRREVEDGCPLVDAGLDFFARERVVSVSFDKPTKVGIETAIEQCKKNAEAMMGPKGSEIIRHHYDEMMKLVTKLPA